MTSEFTLRQARYFLAAVETGTMAAAARQLHVSASAVSLAISGLEQVLNAPLLIRVSHRPLALTVTGSAVIGDLRHLVNAADDLEANTRAEAHEVAGQLRVGCFRTIAPTYVPPMVAATTERHPAIDLQIDELPLEDLQEALLDGHLEVGFLYDFDIRPGLATEILTLTRPYVLLGKRHRLAHRESLHLSELRNEPMVMLDVPPSKQFFTAILDNLDISPPRGRATGSMETLRSLVARDQGWSMLITRPQIDLSYEGLPLRSVEIADPLEPMPIVAAWPAGTRLTRRAEAFLQLSRQTVGRQNRENHHE